MQHRGFSPNQAVGLLGDPEFVGRITGPVVDVSNTFTGKWIVGVSCPGTSGLRGQALVEESKLVALNAPPEYVPRPRGVDKARKARALAQEHAPAEQTH